MSGKKVERPWTAARAISSSHSPTPRSPLTDSILVAEQEAASALPSSLRVHPRVNGLMDSEAVDDASPAALDLLADALARPARYGLNDYGPTFEK